MPYHIPPPTLRLRRTLHRIIDPLRSRTADRDAAKTLSALPDGLYNAGVAVPYVPQFASPSLINDYIYGSLHGKDDPNWRAFGAPDPDTYTFWAQRSCAIACLKMAIDAFGTTSPVPLWTLVQEGIALGGYRLRDTAGNPVDQGWFFEPLVRLGAQYGLQVTGASYVSALTICERIREGWLVAPGVTPEIGERGPIRRYDGHFVLIYGFEWQAGRLKQFMLHNPSGRYPELQAGAVIPAARFRSAFSHRYMAFRPG